MFRGIALEMENIRNAWDGLRDFRVEKGDGYIYIYIYTFEFSIIHGTNGARKIWFQDRRKIKLGEREKSQS